jgi:hypothetical protein
MKKNVIFGIIALLSVSLFFLGCPTEASDDTNPASSVVPDGSAGPDLTSPGAAAAALADALTSIAGVNASDVGVSGNTITYTVPAGTTLTSLPPIPPGTELVITGDDLTVTGPINNTGTIAVEGSLIAQNDFTNSGTLTVDGGGELTVGATLNVAVGGTLDVAGDIINNGNIVVNGTYNIADGVGGGSTNTGTVTIGPGAVVINGFGVNISGAGINVVQAGGTVRFDGDTIPFIGGADAIFNLTSGTFTYDNNGYVLAGAATLTNAKGSEVYLDFSKPLTINNDGALTIAADAILRMSNCVSDTTLPIVGDLGSTGTNAPKIVWSATGSSRFSGSSTYYYFYDNGYSSGAGGGDQTPAAATYEWTDDVIGGGSFAGWVGQ